MAFLAVRIRGNVNKRHDFRKTLESLNLTRVNHAVVIPENEYYEGMLKKAKDLITWGKVDVKTLEDMVRLRGRLMGDNPLTDEHIARETDFEDIPQLCEAMVKNDFNYKNIPGIKPIFRLHPPRKGHGGIKKPYTLGGALGYRAEEIKELIVRMIE